MTDSIVVFPPGFRVLDANGDPLSGAQVRFFVAGTSTPKTVYSDATLLSSLGSIVYTRSDGYLVASQGSSTTVSVFTGSAAYKVDILDADGATVYPAKDNITGALDTSNFLTTGQTSSLVIPVTSIATDTTLSTGNTGTLIHTSGAITITLPNPATVGNDWNIKIRCNDASNATKIVATSGTIKGPGFGVAAMALSGLGAEIEIVCDGANMILANRMLGVPFANGRMFTVESGVTSAPATTAGLYYLVTAGFGAFSTNDILEATGQTTFIGYTPPSNSGWFCYSRSSSSVAVHVGSSWITLAASAFQNLTEDTTPDGTADFLITLDASASAAKKALPKNVLPGRAYATYTTNADLSTTIPVDDTIPQSSEGTEIVTASITPRTAASRIRVRFQGFGEIGTGSHIVAALFQDSGTDALAASVLRLATTTSPQPIGLEFEHSPATTSSVTYRIRVGANSGTMRMNGTNAGRLMGGVGISTLVLEEIFV